MRAARPHGANSNTRTEKGYSNGKGKGVQGRTFFNEENSGDSDGQTGSLATLGATLSIRALRNVKIKDYPFLSMLMPALWNGAIVGWEIEVFFIEGDFNFVDFLVQGGLVALGELAVMLTLGTILYYVMIKRNLDKRLFNQ